MANKKIIKLNVFSKVVKFNQNGKEKTFRSYWTKMLFNGEVKTLTLKFRQEVNVKDIKRGVLTCNAEDVNAPFKYEVKEENGAKVYPVVWVRGYISFESKQSEHKQNDFVIDEEETEELTIDEETGEVNA